MATAYAARRTIREEPVGLALRAGVRRRNPLARKTRRFEIEDERLLQVDMARIGHAFWPDLACEALRHIGPRLEARCADMRSDISIELGRSRNIMTELARIESGKALAG